jgi:hypothetical protein
MEIEMTCKTTEYVEFFGEEFRAHIEYKFVKGYSAGWEDPGCDDEINIINIWLQRGYKGDAPKFKLTREAFWTVRDQDWVIDTCAADHREQYEY